MESGQFFQQLMVFREAGWSAQQSQVSIIYHNLQTVYVNKQ